MAINPEVKYAGKIKPSSVDYPYGEARNITLPGDGTGTPWEAALVNDIFGFQQALLQSAGIVPSGDPDKVGASQYLQALRKVAEAAVASVSDLRARTVPDSVDRLYLVGYYGQATPGGGELYVDHTDTTTADNGVTVFVTANGKRVKRVETARLDITDAGAQPDTVTPIDSALEAAIAALPNGGTLTAYPGEYIISQLTTRIGRFGDGTDGKRTTVDFSGATFKSETDQATRFLVTGKTKISGATFDKVHVFIEGLADESEVSGCEFINQNNHFIRTEVARATITKNVFKSSGSAAAFFNCVSVIKSASGTRIYGNEFNYTAGGAINVDATNGFITEDTLIYGNRFFCNGLKEPSSAVKIEATTRVIIHGNVMDGNARAGTFGIFLVQAVTGEPAPGGIRRVLISDNTITGYETFLYLVASSSTYTGGPTDDSDVIFSGNIVDSCGKPIRRAAGSLLISSNVFRDNDTDIEALEASAVNGSLRVVDNKFFNSLTASIQLGNLISGETVETQHYIIEGNTFRGWNRGAGAGNENVCAIYEKRNAFSATAPDSASPNINIENNVFVTATGNEVNAIAVEAMNDLNIRFNKLTGATALAEPVLIHAQDTGTLRITGDVQYENNSWQLVEAAPSTGKHIIGELWRDKTPSAGGNLGWVCTASGNFDASEADPVFKSYGTIAA